MELRIRFKQEPNPAVFVVEPPVHQTLQASVKAWLLNPSNANRLGEFTAYVSSSPTEHYTVVLNFEMVNAIYHNK